MMDFSSPVTTALLENIHGKAPNNINKEVRCEVCNIQVSSYIVLKDHISGRKHKNQFKIISRKKNLIDLNCPYCAYVCLDVEDWHNHITSESHVEKAKVLKPQPFAEIPPPVLAFTVKPVNPQPVQAPDGSSNGGIQPLFSKQEEIEIRDKLNEKALRQILAKNTKEWKCINCNVICQSQCSWDAHIASRKHKKNKHKFHTYPGISKEFVKKKYQNSFVRAAETIGNEFIDDNVVFYCKRCDVRMGSKLQLEIHMTSNQHKLNHPIAPVPVATDGFYNYEETGETPSVNPVRNQAQLFNFENSSYGYGFRNWSAEKFIFNRNFVPPNPLNQELQRQNEMERQRMLVEEAKNKLLARFPFYAANLVNSQSSSAPQPVPPPPAWKSKSPATFENLLNIPVPPTPENQRNWDPIADFTSDSYN